jgi:hypothetical protein
MPTVLVSCLEVGDEECSRRSYMATKAILGQRSEEILINELCKT